MTPSAASCTFWSGAGKLRWVRTGDPMPLRAQTQYPDMNEFFLAFRFSACDSQESWRLQLCCCYSPPLGSRH